MGCKAYFVMDESGAKGYSDNHEKCPMEFGVAAGFLCNDSDFSRIKAAADVRFESYKNPDGKIHITDIDDLQKEPLRTAVFEFVKENHLQIYYSAICVEGFFEANKPSPLPPNFSSHSLPKEPKKSMHSELLGIASSFALAGAIDSFGQVDEYNVITDNLDKKFVDDIDKNIKELSEKDTSVKKKAYDKTRGTLIDFEIARHKRVFTDVFDGVQQVDISTEVSPMTLIADVLANSIHYYIKENQDKNPNIKLMSKAALEGYPVIDNVIFADIDSTDAIYKHPKKNYQ